jgi:hypothetical protein
MDEQSIKIGGLVEAAMKQQATVELAATRMDAVAGHLQEAGRRLETSRQQTVAACAAAIGEAVTRESQTLAARLEAPFVAPVQRLERAAEALDRAVRRVEWTWMVGVFLLGMLAGLGLMWWGVQRQLNHVLEYSMATYEQTAPKMPTAPANVAPKKGGK